MNGIGAEHRKHRNAEMQLKYKDFFDKQPPKQVVRLPPAITPNIGAVILIIPNVKKTVYSG